LLDPVTGRLWCTYGTFFGYIRIVELDPKTGARVEGNEAKNIAIDCEATTMIYRDGWYYLLGTHGTCCSGANSTYNIRAGRSRHITGPFVDNLGVDMLRGGGKLVIAANGRGVGTGHFGHIDLGDDVEKFSFHYEADLDRGGRSVLEIRPLLWKDGWPVAGDDFKGGTFEIESEGTGYALELGVEAVPLAPSRVRQMRAPRGDGAPDVPGPRGGAGGPGSGGFGRRNAGPATPIPDQDVTEVSKNWPDGALEIRMGNYMLQAHQKWTITPVPDAGGYLGGPYFKITIAGTERTLAASSDAELVAVPAFTGAPEQLWRIDQLIDGTYRIMPKSIPSFALTAVGITTPSLTKFDPDNHRGRWNLRTP
jgi:arabinan endo-1,5-alpha-L-arabinosidase